jgi:hypothetical protein
VAEPVGVAPPTNHGSILRPITRSSEAVGKLANTTLHLHVFALKETTKPDDIAKNYYLEEDYFVIHSLKDKLSAPFIRLEVTEMIKNSE